MKPQRYETNIISIVQETPSTKTLRIEVPQEFTFKPGQFVMAVFELDGKEVRRAYSISSSPLEIGYIDLTIKLEEHGKGGSKKLHTFNEGDSIAVMGPYGLFVMEDDVEHAIFIAASSGIAPFRAMWRYRIAKRLGSSQVFFSTRHKEDLIFYEEMQELQETEDSFKVYCTITGEPPEGWMHHKGRLNLDIIKAESKDYAKSIFYLCGSPQFCEAMKQSLESDGIPKERVKMEKYW